MYVQIVGFSCVILFLFLFERVLTKGSHTPTALVLIPFSLNILLFLILGDYLGYRPLRAETMCILLEGILCFVMVSSLGVGLFFLNPKYRIEQRCENVIKRKPDLWLIILGYIVDFFLIVKLRSIGFESFFSEDAGEATQEFGGGGISAHLLVVAIFILTVLFTRKQSFFSIVLVILTFGCIFLYQVKIWMFAPVIVAILLRVDQGYRISIWKVSLLVLAGVVLFVLAYAPVLGLSWENMGFLSAHLGKYFFAGIAGFNEVLLRDYPIGLARFWGFPNAINHLLGIENRIFSPYLEGVTVSSLNSEWTNVYSLFGSAYLYNGPFYRFLYIGFLSIISNAFYFLKVISKDYFWYNLAYYFWGIGLVLSFFGSYYTLLNIYELAFWALFCGVLFRTNNKHSFHDRNHYSKLEWS